MRYVFLTLLVISVLPIHVCAQYNNKTHYTPVDTTLIPGSENNDNDDSDDEVEVAENNDEESVTHVLREPKELETTKTYAHEKVAVQKFDTATWKKVIGETTFEEKPEKPEKEEPDKTSNITPISIPWNSNALRIIGYVVIIAVVGFILFYVFKNTGGPYNIKTKTFNATDFATAIENIEDLDIRALLKQALDAGNLKLAVRIYFLGLLKKLNEGGVIIWKKDKTNRDYLTELYNKDYYFDDIKNLTIYYEQVWYGEHDLTRDSFDSLSSHFESIYNHLNTVKAS